MSGYSGSCMLPHGLEAGHSGLAEFFVPASDHRHVLVVTAHQGDLLFDGPGHAVDFIEGVREVGQFEPLGPWAARSAAKGLEYVVAEAPFARKQVVAHEIGGQERIEGTRGTQGVEDVEEVPAAHGLDGPFGELVHDPACGQVHEARPLRLGFPHVAEAAIRHIHEGFVVLD